ncbi:hypothetical protein [Streptomyces clavifer]|uniref:hypothetical protein n=1 Tax=Streptomyces clavifer TaxID=68188 RepID=UPI0033A01CB1
MAYYDERLRGLEDRSRSDEPYAVDSPRAADVSAAADALGRSAPRAPRTYRRGLAWVWLAAGLAALGVGIGIGHGVLIAAGLVVAGVAGQLFDPRRRERAPRDRMPHPR